MLKWICERVEGTGKAKKTPIGYIPTAQALDLSGMDLPAEDVAALLSVDKAGWRSEVKDVAADYTKFNSTLPKALSEQLEGLRKRLA